MPLTTHSRGGVDLSGCVTITITIVSILYLTRRSEKFFVTVKTIWLAVPRHVLLSGELGIATQATEMVNVPVLVLGTGVLLAKEDLQQEDREIKIQNKNA